MPGNVPKTLRYIPGGLPGDVSDVAYASGTFAQNPVAPWQFYLPYWIVTNNDTIAHTLTFNTKSGGNFSAPVVVQLPANGLPVSFPTGPFIGVSLDTNGTPSSVSWFYSDIPVTGPPSGAGSTGLAATLYTQNLAAAETNTGSYQMAGFGILYTPLKTGIVRIDMWGDAETPGAVSSGMLQLAWGVQSGGVPVNGAAATGTVFNTAHSWRGSGVSPPGMWGLGGTFTVTVGTPVWIDVQYKCVNTTDGFQLFSTDAITVELAQ